MELGVDKLFSEERLSKKLFYTLLLARIRQRHDGCWKRVVGMLSTWPPHCAQSLSLVFRPSGVKGRTSNKQLNVTYLLRSVHFEARKGEIS